jgi:serine/threonine protein kinase
MPRLVTTIDGRKQEYGLDKEITFGRSSKNTIRIGGSKASREHARIIRRGDAYVLDDLNSSNGTYINNVKIESQSLNHGDVVRIGEQEFTFVDTEVDPLIGQRMGNYQVVERIGRGGMGSVYRARQITMERDVALKVMRKDMAVRAGFVDDFMREARLAGRLQHPNVIAIHDFGQEDGRYFFSMEFVKGETLSRKIQKEGALDAETAVKITSQIAEGLAHAHDQGILHQDIKPQNIILRKDGIVKIADLGLAKVMQYGEEKKPDKPLMGTPQYVAPETVRRLPADARSDIYSLAATAYHMVCGRPPYVGETPTEIVRMHMDAPVPDPRRLMPDLSTALADLIMTCLSKDPARRPQNCRELLEQLKQVETALHAAPVKPTPRAVVNPAPVAAKAQKTHEDTDYLPAHNPYRPLAIGICATVTVAAAALLAWLVFGLLGSDEPTATQKMLARAQSLASAGELEKARDILRELKKQSSPETASATTLLAELENKLAAKTVDVTAPEKNPRLDNPPIIDTPVERQPAKTEADKRADAAWSEASPVIERQIKAGEFAEAATMLETFAANYENTGAATKATARLGELRQKADEANGRIFAEAEALRAKGDKAEARKAFMKLVLQAPDSDWAEKAQSQIVDIESAARATFFTCWRQFNATLPEMAFEGSTLDTPERSVRGLVWEENFRDLRNIIAAADAYRRRLMRDLKTTKVSVVGMGYCFLAVSADWKLRATDDKGAVKDVKWTDIDLDSPAEVAMPEDLEEQEALGAGLYFASRQHKGYSKAYLDAVKPGSRYYPLVSYADALTSGRAVVEYADFADMKTREKWKTMSGDWRFAEGKLIASGGENSQIIMTSRTVSMKNAAVYFTITGNADDGQVALTLKKDKSNFLTARITGTGVILEVSQSGEVTQARGKLSRKDQPLRLESLGGQVFLFASNQPVTRVAAKDCGTWSAQLSLQCIETPASFSNIRIDEAP